MTDDDHARLVEADELMARGDPLGELIAVQNAIAQAPHDLSLQQAEAKLLRDHADWLFSAEIAHATRECDLGWRLGFIHSITWPRRDVAAPSTALDNVLRALATRITGTRLREIVVTSDREEGFDDYDPIGVNLAVDIASLVRHTPPSVRRLEIGSFINDERGRFGRLNITHLHGITPLITQIPSLRELTLWGNGSLAAFDRSHLERFEWRTTSLDNLRAITRAEWPDLVDLSLWLGDGDAGEIDVLLTGYAMPKLRKFGLVNTLALDAICAELPFCDLLQRLDELDLSGGTMTDVGAARLLARSSAFTHLKTLNLERNFISKKMCDRLATLCPNVRLEGQRDSDREWVGPFAFGGDW